MVNIAKLTELGIKSKLIDANNIISEEEILMWLLNQQLDNAEQALNFANKLIIKYKSLKNILALTEQQLCSALNVRNKEVFLLRNFLPIMELFYKIASKNRGDFELNGIGRMGIKVRNFILNINTTQQSGIYVVLVRSNTKSSTVVSVASNNIMDVMLNKEVKAQLSNKKAPCIMFMVRVVEADIALSQQELQYCNDVVEWCKGFKNISFYDYIKVKGNQLQRYSDTTSLQYKQGVISHFYAKTRGSIDRRWNAYSKFLKNPSSMDSVEFIELLISNKVSIDADIQLLAWQILEKCGHLSNIFSADYMPFDVCDSSGQDLSIFFKECLSIYKSIRQVFAPDVLTMDAKSIVDYLIPQIAFDIYETSWLICQDELTMQVHCVSLATGDGNSVFVHPEALINVMCRHNSKKCVLVHTHPFAEAEASCNDIAFTHYLIKEFERIGYTLQDHLIISGTTYTSVIQNVVGVL